ncbi:Calx-beta domain-containing protein [Leifsonia virtsii]|uniref:Calx-beta domain-containing protein n=1 Tax=Leifsonia virtsii TaxID=3035915 RepID=A0ABT8IX55_9MICO|nr:Calx-beta domain-containing protein [Leifsonia virtsii]MDN4596986.1 Calx-beta domain-containing protein [Leifsonia virtsii]
MSRPHARLRLACALTFAGIATLLGVAPAAATPATPPAGTLVPLVDCVQDAPLGAVTARTVVLGYRSTASAPVAIPAGSGGNDLTSGAADRGQPTSFGPGEHHGVWLLTVDAAAEPDLAWRLGDGVAAFAGAPACTAATSVTLSVPDRVSAGGTVPVCATVARMLLAAPDTGTVAFSLDGAAPLTAPVSPSGVARAELPVAAAGAHTVTATYQPAQGSSLLASSGTAAFTATAATPSSPLAVAADSVVTGSSSVLVTVSRAVAQGTATVDVMTADGSARAGADYTAVATTLTLADGQASATVRVPLGVRPAGSPAATFFVLLQRSSAAVATASATVTLPAVPANGPTAASAATSRVGGGADGPSASSALPAGDPTATGTGTLTNAGQDLAFLLGGVLLTGGGIAGILGLVRAAALRGPRP